MVFEENERKFKEVMVTAIDARKTTRSSWLGAGCEREKKKQKKR
jgi:hypothetical protein